MLVEGGDVCPCPGLYGPTSAPLPDQPGLAKQWTTQDLTAKCRAGWFDQVPDSNDIWPTASWPG